MRLREFAPAGGGGSGDYFQALASAWYNGTFDSGSLQKGIKSQQDVERLLNRGIVCPDGKTRKLHIDYNSDFDGVEIYSDDYYEYGDHDDTIDSRTGQKWGPYDFMAFSDEDLSEGAVIATTPGSMDPGGAVDNFKQQMANNTEIAYQKAQQGSLNEFSPDDSGDGSEEDALRNYARMWWAGDEATQMQIERALAKMGWEIGEDEGGYDNGGVFVVRAGDVNGDSYTSWAAEDLTEGLTEGVLTEAEVKDQAVKILKGLAWGATKGAKGLWWAVTHPVQAVAAGVAITHPQGTWNAANFGWNMVSDPAGTIGTLAKYGASSMIPWSDKKKAVADLNSLLGNSATSDAIFALADLAVQYALPIAGVVALLYGGSKWMEWLKQNDAAEPGKKAFDRIANEPRGNTQPAPQAQAQLQAPQKLGMTEGSEDPFGPQGRFVGDTGPAQLTTTVPRVKLKIGDRVIYKPTERRATIVGLSRDGTQARIDMPSPMGGRVFNCKTADLKAPGQGLIKEKSTSQAQFRTMAAAAHDPKFARKVGIKPSVAQEFNRADRGQSYKSLPKKS